MYLIMASALGIILCQYTVDSLFQHLNGGTIYAIQLMPEAKILTETHSSDYQPFANNFFCASVGFGIVLLVSMLFSLMCGIQNRRGAYFQGVKFYIVVIFALIMMCNFLKPCLHINSKGKLIMDKNKISQMFFAMEMFNPYVGFAFGVLAYSTAISQMVCVPELLIYT